MSNPEYAAGFRQGMAESGWTATKVGVGVAAAYASGGLAAPYLGAGFLGTVGTGMVAGGVGNLAVQGVERATGERSSFSGSEFAASSAFGGVLSGGVSIAGRAISNMLTPLAENVSLWQNKLPGVQVRQFGDWWAKRVNPDANPVMQWWGQQTIDAQYGALQKLGDMATENAMRNRVLFTRDVGETFADGFRLLNPVSRSAYVEGSARMGDYWNDIQPRNMGVNGSVFDPAIDPFTKAVTLSVGAGVYGASSGGASYLKAKCGW